MKQEKKYLDGTRIEDLRGMKFGELTVVEFDWDRYIADKKRSNDGVIGKQKYHWICVNDYYERVCIESSKLKYRNNIKRKIKKCDEVKRQRKKLNNIKKQRNIKRSFEQWCLENNHQDYLDLWDYELNDIKPSEVTYSINKKYWFKCSRGLHDSELWIINNMTSIKKNGVASTMLSCRKCNSFGQYLLDTYGDVGVETYWSCKNDISPFEISKSNSRLVWIMCDICGNEKQIKAAQFRSQGLSCDKCSDGISYPNKFLFGILKQLKCSFSNEYREKWTMGKIYDFIVESNIIIEAHGGQHYDVGFYKLSGKTLEEEQANDRLKRELALNNGIKHYIELDCRKSELEFIKNSVMNSKLPSLLNFNEEDIDWIECNNYACSSRVKEVCDLWNSGIKSTIKIGEIVNASYPCVCKMLKKGADGGMTDYTVEKRYDENYNGKKVNCLTIVRFDEEQYELDKLRVENCEIKYANWKCICRCECGKEKSMRFSDVVKGKYNSCGCKSKFKQSIGDFIIENSGNDGFDRIWSKNNEVDAFSVGSGVNRFKTKFICEKCNYEYSSVPLNYKKGHRCPVCAGKIKG